MDNTRCINSGEIAHLPEEGRLEITEIPIRVAINTYKLELEFMSTGIRTDADGNKEVPKDKDKAKKDANLIKLVSHISRVLSEF